MVESEEAIDRYLSNRISVLRDIFARTTGDARKFVHQSFTVFAAEMVASNFQFGCLMQNLANELPALDPKLTKRIANGFVILSAIAEEHLRACGFTASRARTSAAALTAGVEGARTIARLERTTAVFKALEEISVQGWAAPKQKRRRA